MEEDDDEDDDTSSESGGGDPALLGDSDSGEEIDMASFLK
jgi:hypothetical protein